MARIRNAAIALGVSTGIVAGGSERAWAQGHPETAEVSEAARLRARGIELAYNLDRAEARDAFTQAAALEPADSTAFRLAAATTWMQLLFAQGAISVDDYLGEAEARVDRAAPDPALAATFHDDLNRAVALSDARLRARPDDPESHYQVGAAAACLASFTATIEGKVYASFGQARRAYREHERTLAMDPRRADAGLIVGLYRYAVASLSLPVRLFVNLAGIGGGRERGVRLVEAAAAGPADVEPNALFSLILIYNRERRYDDASNVIRRLQRLFPRNRLLWLEAGVTALRAGRPQDARIALEEGLRRLAADPRPRALGEVSRWHLAYGQALMQVGDRETADSALRAALADAVHDWVRGRIHRELGKIADLAGDRPRAVREYQQARALCTTAGDSDCTAESTRLLRSAYRGGPPS